MKKILCVILALIIVLSMTACGGKQDSVENDDKGSNQDNETKVPDMDKVFESMKDKLPSDLPVFDNERAYDAYGVDPAECKQEMIASLYAAGAPVELWLIEAVSEDALAGIKELANARLTSLCEQFHSYDAEAYEIALNGKIITEGNCLVMIVAENAEDLWDIYNKV